MCREEPCGHPVYIMHCLVGVVAGPECVQLGEDVQQKKFVVGYSRTFV